MELREKVEQTNVDLKRFYDFDRYDTEYLSLITLFSKSSEPPAPQMTGINLQGLGGVPRRI